MKISVIIPMYNAIGSIERCLKSVIGQSFRDLEIIVVDDGSTDGSRQMALQIAADDCRVRVISQDNKGLVGARKTGISEASGEYILFVDSDDYIDRTMIEELASLVELHGADVVLEGARIFMGDKSMEVLNFAPPGVYEGKELKELKKTILHAEDYCTMQFLPYLWNKLFRRELITRHILDADESITIGEDVSIGFPAILEADRIVVSKGIHYNYVKSASSMMAVKNEDREFRNAVRLYAYIKERFDQIGFGEDDCLEGVRRLFINQLLTRTYETANRAVSCNGLFPFLDKVRERLIIYGAGEFGKEVYNRARKMTSVKYWIDQNAKALSEMGYDVVGPEECTIDQNDEIVVAVLSAKATVRIVDWLIQNGADENRIHTFALNDKQKQELIRYGEDHYLRN